MSEKLKIAICLILLPFLLQTASAQTLPPRVQWIPQDAVISLELSQPRVLIELLTNEDATKAVTSLPVYKQQESNPKFNEFVNVINFLEGALGTDWRDAISKLTGGGITFAVCPEDTVVLIVDAEDEQILNRLHDIILGITRSEADNDGQPERVASKEYLGVKAWTFNAGKEAHAIIGSRLILSNRPEGLRSVLELRENVAGTNLESNLTYQAAKQAAAPKDVGSAFVNLGLFMSLPNIAGLLDKQSENPLAALLFSGIIESARNSNWLALGLQIEESKELSLRLTTDGKIPSQGGPAAFALPGKAEDGALPNLSVPRQIAAMSLYRDLYGFYSAKDDLFPQRTSGLIFFENMMGIFFTGRDLTNEVLAETKPQVRIVVAEQKYNAAIGTPQVRLPAFAVVLGMRNPEKFSEIVEEAWQKAIGLVNFTRGQQAMPGLIIDRPVHGDTKMTVASFSTAGTEGKTNLDQQFNFRPTLAMPGEYLILSSTDGLARDLIDTLSAETENAVKPLAQTHSLVEIGGGQLASALDANRETMIQSDMVKKGNTRQEAEAGIDMFITLVKFVDRVKLGIDRQHGLAQAELKVKLNLP